MNSDSNNDIYFEFTQIGSSVKVAAIDGKTGVEVSVVGNRMVEQTYLQNLAKRKLKKRLSELLSQ